MAKNLNQVNGGATLTPTGGRLYIAKPAATPSGFEDHYITYENLVSIISGLIANNTAVIAIHEGEITILQSLLSKQKVNNVTGDYSFINPADCQIYQFCIYWQSGTSVTVSIGTTNGGTDILEPITLTSTNSLYVHDCIIHQLTNQQIYINISGGLVDIVRFFKTTVNT